MAKKTTFFCVEVVGPCALMTRITTPDDPDYPRQARLVERSATAKYLHRPGRWSAEALQRLAQRGGAQLVRGYHIAQDSKGFIPSSERTVYQQPA